MAKKRSQPGPRRKRLDRAGRLQSAKATGWVNAYQGKDLIHGYCTWFALDPVCAVIELRQLGVQIDWERERQVRKSAENTAAARRAHRRRKAEDWESPPDSDDTFAYIAGYTSWGFRYGVTWEEVGEAPPWRGDEESEASLPADVEDGAPEGLR